MSRDVSVSDCLEKGMFKPSLTSGENPAFISATGPEFLNSKGESQTLSLGGELHSSLCSGEKFGPLQVEATAGTSASKEDCNNWLWSRVKDTRGLSSISGDDSKLLPAISSSSGDTCDKTWFEDSSDFSITSINSSPWFGLAEGLLWSFVSGDDPTLPLSFTGVLGMSLSTGEDSGLFCPGEELNLSLSLHDAVTSS